MQMSWLVNLNLLNGVQGTGREFFVRTYSESLISRPKSLDYVNRILREERDIAFAAKPLETSRFQVENIQFTYVFYEDGLAINVMYTVDDPKKRAVGFKLSEGMEVPKELEGKFKFARQKSKLAGTIRGSFFVIKGQY